MSFKRLKSNIQAKFWAVKINTHLAPLVPTLPTYPFRTSPMRADYTEGSSIVHRCLDYLKGPKCALKRWSRRLTRSTGAGSLGRQAPE